MGGGDREQLLPEPVTHNSTSLSSSSPSNSASLNDGKNEPIRLCFVNIEKYSQTTQFIVCCLYVFVCFIIYGYSQEKLFTIKGFHEYGWFLTTMQFAIYTGTATMEIFCRRLAKGSSKAIFSCYRRPAKSFILLGFLTLGTMGFSNASLGFLNYPTQVIFKCCKLIPVMIGSITIQGKRYGPLDFLAAILMCIGLILFTLADSQLSPNFNLTGIIMICMALFCDAIIGNVQEKCMKYSNASTVELVVFSYGIGFMTLISWQFFSGMFFKGIYYYHHENVPEKFGYTFLFSFSGYFGIHAVLILIKTCGAFAAVTVTTCRKAVTMILSFIFFSKPFTFQYLWSGILVILGIYLNFYSKKHSFTMKELEIKLSYFFEYLLIKFKLKSTQSKSDFNNVKSNGKSFITNV